MDFIDFILMRIDSIIREVNEEIPGDIPFKQKVFRLANMEMKEEKHDFWVGRCAQAELLRELADDVFEIPLKAEQRMVVEVLPYFYV